MLPTTRRAVDWMVPLSRLPDLQSVEFMVPGDPDARLGDCGPVNSVLDLNQAFRLRDGQPVVAVGFCQDNGWGDAAVQRFVSNFEAPQPTHWTVTA